MSDRQVRPGVRAVAVCGAVLLCGGVAGCGGDTEDGKAPAGAPAVVSPAAPTAGKPPKDPADAVREVYRAMWSERMKALQVASAEGTDLERYVAPGVLRAFERELARLKKDGMVVRGRVGHEPEVAVLDTGEGVRGSRATVEDCLDLSKWQPLDITTGWPLPLPGDQPVRHRATAELQRGDGGRWTVTAYLPDRSRAC
ncbi:hypothetical protein ACFQ6U_16940 [Streptomyces sp. NPDC056465]|uniref:hypothetical protein n=1 Tax=unclassified Streptomyces TaxID=2593676 RepID=UPI0036C83491